MLSLFFCFIQFKAKQFVPRTPESYDYHCSLLNSDLCEEHSTTYGVNFESPLNEFDNFHVINQLPQDIMHVLLEGAIPYELSLMLTSFVSHEKYFTLDQLNDRIACFSYSHEEVRDKPSLLKSNSLSSKSTHLGQSGEPVVYINFCLVMMIINFFSGADVDFSNQPTSYHWRQGSD